MTTAADQNGQSVLEFLLVLPLLMAMTMFLIKVDMVIQEGIVDEQYSRAQVLYISGNGARYPRRAGIVQVLAPLGYNQLVVGVSNNYVTNGEDGEGDGDNSQSAASVLNIARSGVVGNDEDQQEPNDRAKVRVRNTVTLCLPMISIGGRPVYPDPIQLNSANGTPQSPLSDNPKQFDFCSSPLPYEDT